MLGSDSFVFLTVYARNFGQGEVWLPGIISEVTGPVSYVIKLTDGRTVRRHQDHVRRRYVLPEPLLIPEQVVEPVAETVQQEQDTGSSPSVPQSQECVMPERRYPVHQRHPPERFM